MGSKSTGKTIIWVVIILAIVALLSFMMYNAAKIGGQVGGAFLQNPAALAAFV